MGRGAYDSYYGCVFETAMQGTLALQLPLAYPSHATGIIPPPTIDVQVWGVMLRFVYNDGQAALARAFDTSQQNVSRYLDKGELVRVKVQDGTYTEKDIWGYSPTEKRGEALGTPKERKIIINGVDLYTRTPELTYEGVCHLAGIESDAQPTVTFRNGPGTTVEGSLLPGQRVGLAHGMVFNVRVTSGA